MVALVLASSLLLVVGESPYAVDGPHQERQNRLLPDFEPFDHPSKKIGDPTSTRTKGLGPISEVEWVEEVVPVFGKIQIQKKVGTADSSSYSKMPLILTLVIGGCLLCGVLIKQKSTVEQTNVNKQKDNLSEVNYYRNIQPELPPTTTVSGNKNRHQDENISPRR